MPDPRKLFDRLTPDQRDDVVAYMAQTLPLDQLESLVKPEPRFKALTGAEFMAKEYRRDWLVKGVLVAGQFAVLGGAKKSLKTSTLVDLVIALASGGYFLGHFRVPKPVRVAIFSGESGEATLQETARRVAQARGVDLCENSHWLFDLPQLTNESDVLAVGDFIEDNKIEVAVIDPLYLCVSGPKVDHTNLYTTGPVLRGFAKTCLDRGATPLIAHHTKKLSRREEFLPIDLDDLAFAGIAEIARQWLLLSRRAPYEEGTGSHALWFKLGGSAGHSGLYEIDVDEGAIDEEFTGRNWDVNVRKSGGVAGTRTKDQASRISKDAELVLAILQGANEPLTRDEVTDKAGLTKGKIRTALKSLQAHGRISEAGPRKGKSGMAPMTYLAA